MVLNIFGILKSCISNVLIFILSLCVTPLLFTTVILLSPIYLFRFFVSKISRVVRPDLGNLLTTRSTITGVDDNYGHPKCGVYSIFIMEGDMKVEELRERMIEVVNVKNEDGKLIYPELRQSITQFLGFLFWKWDPDFDIKNHVKYFNFNGDNETFPDKEISEDEFKIIMPKLNGKPFVSGRAPWEQIIFRNYRPKYTDRPDLKYSAYVIRVAHGLSDAYSYLKLFGRHAMKDEAFLHTIPTPASASFNKTSKFMKTLGSIWMLLKMPFDVAKFNIGPADVNHGWRKTEKELTHDLFFGVSKHLSLEYMKDIKTSLNARMTSVIFAGIAGGIRSMMVQEGLKLPKFIKVAVPFPMPNHPYDKLRNHMSLGVMTLPIEEPDSLTRLRLIDNHFHELSFSSVPMAAFILAKLVGGLFVWMVKDLTKSRLCTGLISNVPGSSMNVSFLGLPITDVFFAGGLLRGDVGIVFSCATYAGRMRLTAMADRSIIDSVDKIQQLMAYIEDELDTLTKLGSV